MGCVLDARYRFYSIKRGDVEKVGGIPTLKGRGRGGEAMWLTTYKLKRYPTSDGYYTIPTSEKHANLAKALGHNRVGMPSGVFLLVGLKNMSEHRTYKATIL